MPWIHPYGFEDPGGGWSDEELAFDNDVATNAHHVWVVTGTWTGWLVLLFSPTVTDRLRFYFGPNSWPFFYQVEVYDGETWTNVADVNLAYGPDWFDITFDPQRVVKARFRYKHYGALNPLDGIAEFIIGRGCGGPLGDICELLRGVGTFFIDLASDIRELWLVGEYLAIPFENLGAFFLDGADTCCKASGTLQDILDALEGSITAESLLALFEDHWPTLYNLITDPVGWFLVQLTLAFDLEPYHTQSLEFLAKWILEEYFPTLYHIWLDPEQWLFFLLQDRFPLLFRLITDPEGEILYLIGQAFDLEPYEAQSGEFIVKALFERWFPALYQLWLDPEAWLVEHVDPRILGVGEEIADFIADPWGWLLDKFEERFDTFKDQLYSLAEHVLRVFMEGVW